MIGQERDDKHPQNNIAFNILSLLDQLHCFKSPDWKGLE